MKNLNHQTAFFPELKGDGQNGHIYAANDANFDAEHLSEPLTEFLVDFPDEDGLLELVEGAAPSIPVGRSFSYRIHDSKEAFQADIADEDIREIGGEFAQVRRTGTQSDGRTDNKGLVMVLDNDQGGEDPAVQQRAITNLRDRLLRTELYRLEALLEANDTEASKNWGATATSADPDAELLEQIDLSGDARGIDANTVLFGGSAWIKRNLATRRSDKAGGFASATLTPETLAGLLGVDKVLKAKHRFQSSSTAKTKIVADKVYAYYAKGGLMPDDPSNIKRFITMTEGGAFRVYIEPVLKRTRIAVEHYSRIILTSSLGIRKIAVTYT